MFGGLFVGRDLRYIDIDLIGFGVYLAMKAPRTRARDIKDGEMSTSDDLVE